MSKQHVGSVFADVTVLHVYFRCRRMYCPYCHTGSVCIGTKDHFDRSLTSSYRFAWNVRTALLGACASCAHPTYVSAHARVANNTWTGVAVLYSDQHYPGDVQCVSRYCSAKTKSGTTHSRIGLRRPCLLFTRQSSRTCPWLSLPRHVQMT